ncbi:MAG: type I pullulanase [Ruminococcus sp.]|uniref:type I pullulanase n=1 Tax=Ruminococcus sp. TaxID=41978 RepID=UPI0025E5CF4D|nr:type I pullulanase [Ruminococcus sp.]MCR5540746.1 type I pullulanase [Ruminococcus sp.]
MLRYNAADIDNKYYYDGNDLGANIVGEEKDRTVFKTWSPLATGVYLNLYLDGEGDNLVETLPMEMLDKGVWYVELFRSCDGLFYTFSYEFEYMNNRMETIDIYAKACGINGNRGAIVDFDTTDPIGWDKVSKPKCLNACQAIVYECHVRDITIDESSGVCPEHRGKFLGFTHSRTRCGKSETCLDHLKELGITHVHLLPVADYATVDEAHPEKNQYNWGYDPKNYNCLEGSYSTDPADPKCRIREFKELVMTLHKNGIGVIMDVVYNHTYHTEDSSFEKAFPGYYHRKRRDGTFSNGSGCGNETASDHKMFRKFMIDSLKFWATEYKVDGFRFDLMALHDIETVNIIRDELDKIDPSLLMYGEGWTGGESPMPADKLAYKWNSYEFGRVGLFNDNIRDSVKGGTFNPYDLGFISGNRNTSSILKRGIAGSVPHYQLQDASEACWAFEPTQAVNYAEAHDNHTLWDKLKISGSNHYCPSDLIKMDCLAAAIIILSQGMPFIQLGQDFLRSKPRELSENESPNELNVYSGNSYNAPDHTNAIKWNKKNKYRRIFNYYKALIKLRKSSELFRMANKGDVERHLQFMDSGDANFIIWKLENEKECFVIALNPYPEERYFNLPWGIFYKRLDECGFIDDEEVSGYVRCAPLSATVFKRI